MPDRLDSWKEIAAYLKRDVTTVRRWEKREGLPVHRHLHERRDSVYAYAAEIDAWWEGRRHVLATNGQLNSVDSREENAAPSDVQTHTSLFAMLRRPAMAWTVAGASLAAVLTLTVVVARSRPEAGPDRREVRFEIVPPSNTSFGSVSLSPDGRQLAFTAAASDGAGFLWIRPLDSTTARQVKDSNGARFPFWSPTSDAVGFFADGKLWTVELADGQPRPIGEAPLGRGGTWNRDGVIVFAPGREGGLFRVAASGGAATPVTTVSSPRERGHVWPEFLPDGNHFLYLADSNTLENHSIVVAALDGSEPRPLLQMRSNAVYADSGHLIFERERTLVAQPFDVRRLAITGDPVTLVDRVQPGIDDHKADFSVSAGILAYRRMQSPASRLVWRDRVGPRATLAGTPGEYYDPTLSPDESRVAIGQFDPELSQRFGYKGLRSNLWILDRATGAAAQLTSDPTAEYSPVWSPDGRSIVYSSNRSGSLELYRRDVTGEPRADTRLVSEGTDPVAQSWSPDGRFLAYVAFDPQTHLDVWILPMAGDPPRPFLRSPFNERQPQISPDGRWLAYASNESGREEVYVQAFPTSGPKSRVSVNGGADPRWRRDGKELFFVAEDRQLTAVSVDAGATFAHGLPVPLFDTVAPAHWYAARNLYDVSRDGSFLFMSPVEDDRSSAFTIVIDWIAALHTHAQRSK